MEFKFTMMVTCHKCGRSRERNRDELDAEGWLDPYNVSTGPNSTLQTALCPDCIPVIGTDRLRALCFKHKLRLGRVSHMLAPGFSSCHRCDTCWHFVREHCTDYEIEPSGPVEGEQASFQVTGSGCFPLCQWCWEELTPDERMPYYKQLWDSWAQWGERDEKQWFAIQEAVLRGK